MSKEKKTRKRGKRRGTCVWCNKKSWIMTGYCCTTCLLKRNGGLKA